MPNDKITAVGANIAEKAAMIWNVLLAASGICCVGRSSPTSTVWSFCP